MICFHLSQHADYEDKSRKWWLDFGGIFKILQIYERYDGGNKMQIDNTDLFLKLFYIQCKEIGNKKYCEESRELEKLSNWDFAWILILEKRR